MSAWVVAAIAGAGGAAGLCDLLASAPFRIPAVAGPLRSAADSLARAGREGHDPGAAERRRLLLTGALVALAGGWFLLGVKGGVVLAAAGPAVMARILSMRRERYRRAVEQGAAEIALALADALSGGHSLRGAVIAVAGTLEGPPGSEMRKVAGELALGAATDDALDGLRARVRAPALDLIVSAALLQRQAGGDLAGLLRGAARSFEEEARLAGEVRAATAQARFTGLVVVLLPLGGAILAELASPGFVARLAASPLSAWLVGMAVAMQAGAAFAIRRLARMRA